MFYIIEQGARVQTPVDQLLQARGVAAVDAPNRMKAIGPDTADQSPQPANAHVTPYLYQDEKQESPRGIVIYAHQIMTAPVVTAFVHQTLNEVWSIFSKRGFHHLPLVDDQQQLQGIVSDRDLLRFAANNNREVGSYPIGQLMTRKIISSAEQTEIRTIAEVMCNRAIGAIPIVNDDVEVVGIVSRSDILRTLVHQAPLALWA